MTNDNDLKYFCLGMGLGVAAGFLLAPKSGSETRNLIQSKSMQGKDYLRNQASAALDSAAGAIERGAKSIRHQKENVAAAVEAGRAAFEEAEAATPPLFS